MHLFPVFTSDQLPVYEEALLAASALSTPSNTSFVECGHLSWCENNRRLTRKTIAFSIELPWHVHKFSLGIL
jgi:IS1 family transposase